MTAAIYKNNPDLIISCARKCKTRTEFEKTYPGAYKNAKVLGIYDQCCEHMTYNDDHRISQNQTLYCYKFPNNKAYVGVTPNLKRRHREHMEDKSFRGLKIRELTKKYGDCLKVLEENLDPDTASKLERQTIADYRKNGWELINRDSGGKVGVCVSKHTEHSVLEKVRCCETLTEFRKKYPKEYKWWQRHMPRGSIASHTKSKWRPAEYWTEDVLRQIAEQYDRPIDMFRANQAAYYHCNKIGLMEKFFGHKGYKAPRKKNSVTYEVCAEAAKQCSSSAEMKRRYKVEYTKSCKKGWLVDLKKLFR